VDDGNISLGNVTAKTLPSLCFFKGGLFSKAPDSFILGRPYLVLLGDYRALVIKPVCVAHNMLEFNNILKLIPGSAVHHGFRGTLLADNYYLKDNFDRLPMFSDDRHILGFISNISITMRARDGTAYLWIRLVHLKH
jgi:hypothetical protein